MDISSFLDKILADEKEPEQSEALTVSEELPPVPSLPDDMETSASESRIGRPRVWPTKELLAEALEAIESGAPKWIAIAASGVSQTQWIRWAKSAKAADGSEHSIVCQEFIEALDVAHAKAARNASRSVFLANPLQWLTKGPGRELGREKGPHGWGQGWGESSQVELTGAEGGPIKTANLDLGIDFKTLNRDERKTLRAILEKARSVESDDGGEG